LRRDHLNGAADPDLPPPFLALAPGADASLRDTLRHALAKRSKINSLQVVSGYAIRWSKPNFGGPSSHFWRFKLPTVAPEMQVESSEMRAKRRRKDGRRSHGKAKLTLGQIDKRTAAGQHALTLVRAFEADLGGTDNLSVAVRQLVQRAAVLGTLIESIEVRWLAGEQIELLDLLAATNTQRRLLSDLGLERRARDVSPSLEMYSKQLEAAAAK
jgi:hypothetical protein